ncbi:MAG: hypothetical protein FRX48_04841 [Lasallia pustulata]|uniref:Uncharacterized protein n=1 Tax=Lasallia pustulata TaxID=136370 RepID=A0A5M8PSH9_9LECA|nr:MAG: hypothetical protein FRX48_04841 [Lasallia pustulata]
MSSDHSMEDYLAGNVADKPKLPYTHLGVATSLGDHLTDNHDIGIEIEEILDPNFEPGTDIKVLKPDEYEEPPDLCLQESDPDSRTPMPPDPTAQQDYLIQGLRKLHCDDSDTKDGSHSWVWNSKHQRTRGIRKRSHSQSTGSETDIRYTEHPEGHKLEDNARRLRRRVRERRNQSPTVLGRTQDVNTIEIEEADNDAEAPPATFPSSNGGIEVKAVDELGDIMDMD